MSGTNALGTESLSLSQVPVPATGRLPPSPGKSGTEAPHPPVSRILADELELFHDFTQRHLWPFAYADVQCMLIWAEWVRYCLKQTRNFPRIILEQEFNYLITGLFMTKAALDERRGRIYPGIRFLP